jgi:hypothetical protein
VLFRSPQNPKTPVAVKDEREFINWLTKLKI